jgi:predicted adenylyl cyclase CyaB
MPAGAITPPGSRGRNVEIKARIADLSAARKIAEGISDAPAETIRQEDIFYETARGRLKLRILAEDRGELIAYDRPALPGPKESRYRIYHTSQPRSLAALLGSTLDARGEVRKVRLLFLSGQTRIHLDEVEGLGSFLEFEVVLHNEQPPEEGIAIARHMMSTFDIEEADLIPDSYIDILERAQTGEPPAEFHH